MSTKDFFGKKNVIKISYIQVQPITHDWQQMGEDFLMCKLHMTQAYVYILIINHVMLKKGKEIKRLKKNSEDVHDISNIKSKDQK